MPNFRAIKICRGTIQQGYPVTISNLQIVFNTRKNPYLNHATPDFIYQNFPTPKHPEIENFNPQKNPLIIPGVTPRDRITPQKCSNKVFTFKMNP